MLIVSEWWRIKRQQPDKVPIIIERYDTERNLPILDHCKYLVPSHITVADVMQIIRRRLHLHPDQAFFLLINEKSMVSITMTVGQLYEMEQEKDGFLYIVYASQPALEDQCRRTCKNCCALETNVKMLEPI
uniref:Uncharacterized protein n=1 Tax=Ditylenchus dipsaci TaxID=166011 RepID=A0A915E5N0_9BILA